MKNLLYILALLLFISSVSADCRGSFHIVDSENSNPNSFNPGESVYVYGEKFPVDSSLDYEVTFSDTTVISGSILTNSEGDIEISKIWDIPVDYENLGVHRVEINYDGCQKSKNIKVEGNVIPEFSGIGIALAGVFSLLGILFLRK
ncbi:MAG: hypothetical protein ABIB47_00490 [Candidatus Woesearchaeota archaeon]